MQKHFFLFLQFLFILLFCLTCAEKEYDKAIEWYTEAIKLDPENAVYYANRSLAHLRQESYGYALQDAISAVKADPIYIKGKALLWYSPQFRTNNKQNISV